MIHEYFDESLVLLKRLMGWSLFDIVYIKAREKVYRYKYKLYADDVMQKHKLWSALDYQLYEYFHAKFLTYLGGDASLRAEVTLFRRINSAAGRACQQLFRQLHDYRAGRVSTAQLLQLLESPLAFSGGRLLGKDCVVLAIDPAIFTIKPSMAWLRRSVGQNAAMRRNVDRRYEAWRRRNVGQSAAWRRHTVRQDAALRRNVNRHEAWRHRLKFFNNANNTFLYSLIPVELFRSESGFDSPLLIQTLVK